MLVWVGMGLLLYALSPGPVVQFLPPSPHKGLETFYAPLILLYQEVPPVGAFYNWYLDLWDIR